MSSDDGETGATTLPSTMASTSAFALPSATAEIERSAITLPISTLGGTTTTTTSTEARCAVPSTGKYIQLYDLLAIIPYSGLFLKQKILYNHR